MRSKSTDSSSYVRAQASTDSGVNGAIHRNIASFDVDSDVVWNRGSTTVCWIDERPAITADVVVVPVFWKPQPGKRFFRSFAVTENVSAVKAGVADAVLINGDQPQPNSNENCGGRLQIRLPVLHRWSSTPFTIACTQELVHPPEGPIMKQELQ